MSRTDEAVRRTGALGRITVWYDGACPLCIREIALMRRLDRRNAITFTDVSVPAISSEDGHLLSGAAAFAAMWRAIPVLRPLGLLARVPGVLAVLELLYQQFLKVRPRIQKRMKPMD